MNRLKERLKNWAIRHAEGPYSKIWLSFFAFAESSFFPIPIDFILIPILLSRQAHRWFFYATLTVVFSVLGGIFGYLIGYLFYETIGANIVSFYGLETQIETVSNLFNKNTFGIIFLAAFTPIPYKIFTLSAGLFQVNFIVFIVASILGRGIRFYLESYLMKIFGSAITRVLYRYFNIFSMIFIVLIGIIVYIFVR